LCLIFYEKNHLFFSSNEISTQLTAFSGIILLCVAEMYVIVSGGIDLSVGSILGVSGIVGAEAMNHLQVHHFNNAGILIIGTLVCAAVGAFVGSINALMITVTNLVPFVATLVTYSAGAGVALVLTGGEPVGLNLYASTWGTEGFGPFTYVTLIIVLITIMTAVYLHTSRFGRYTFAVGSNEFAARGAGIHVKRHIASVYILAGLLSGLVGMFWYIQLGQGSPTAGGSTTNLTAIAAVVIGGTSLFGGKGRMVGTIIGAILITVVTDGLIFINVSSTWDQVVIGALIAMAAILQTLRSGKQVRTT
jgi:ribose transport system permease protein